MIFKNFLNERYATYESAFQKLAITSIEQYRVYQDIFAPPKILHNFKKFISNTQKPENILEK